MTTSNPTQHPVKAVPARTWAERTANPIPADPPKPRRTFQQWWRTCNDGYGPVPYLVAFALAAAAFGALGWHLHQVDKWIANAWTVEQALNAKYDSRIQVNRMKVDRAVIEMIVVDGQQRLECRVPDDANPTLDCGGTPVR